VLDSISRCRTHVKALSIVEGAFFYLPEKGVCMPKESIDLDKLVDDLSEFQEIGRMSDEPSARLVRMGCTLSKELNAELKTMLNDPSLADQREAMRFKISRLEKAMDSHLHNRNKAVTKAHRDGTAPTKRPRKGRSVHGPQPRKKSKAK
jgi:hypothetical protein